MQYAIGLIAKPLGILLSAIYGAVNNYGVALIILTVIVRGCLYPLYASQVKSTAAMAGLQPKIKEIQTKYANDKEMMNVKMMELYKEEKFNPAGGCLPMLIQMPIIFGLFELLRHPLNYLSDDMILAIHESFVDKGYEPFRYVDSSNRSGNCSVYIIYTDSSAAARYVGAESANVFDDECNEICISCIYSFDGTYISCRSDTILVLRNTCADRT